MSQRRNGEFAEEREQSTKEKMKPNQSERKHETTEDERET